MEAITGSTLVAVNGFICGYALSAGMFGWATLHAMAAAVALIGTVAEGGE
jgi:hypothetical protein